MPIRLISQKEKLKFIDSSGAEFFYRRITAPEYRSIERDKTNRGLVDFDAVGLETVKRCLLNWKNIVDQDGKEVPFSSDKVDFLPGAIISILFVEIRSNSGMDRHEDLEKKL